MKSAIPPLRQTCLGVMRIRRADTFWSRLGGLLVQPPLGPQEALLITPCNSIHTLGMRYAIDVLFLDGEGRVLAQHARIRPQRFCLGPAGTRHTVELPAGILAGRQWLGWMFWGEGSRTTLEARR